MKELNEIASTHLGRSSDGVVAAPYVAPTQIDKKLLVAVPRNYNRVQYGLNSYSLPFVGYDVWNAYEFSALTHSGFPATGQIKITYSANSVSIVESKSLKLYLNSFNMVRLGEFAKDVIRSAENIITCDLQEILGSSVRVKIFGVKECEVTGTRPFVAYFKNLDLTTDVSGLAFEYNENPELLQVSSTAQNVLSVHTTALRSNCRVTNQPDWGDVYISMSANKIPTDESLLQYIVSLRNENHFHEEICECIYKRLWDKFSPRELFVGCLYTRRGGIDINPIRASSEEIVERIAPNLVDQTKHTAKTWRQ
jgi:7-cyano-7-deazaguanine reductase